MLYLSSIFHMHQPYYVDLLTRRAELPWVRLHGAKDYLDMVQILNNYPAIRQVFNIVPSLFEQIEGYASGAQDKYLELSLKPAPELNEEEKGFLLQNFFSISKERVISLFPRYLELFYKRQARRGFNNQDFLDLQVLFNLAWIDPCFRKSMPELSRLCCKARFFGEEYKRVVIDTQLEILSGIIPAYKKAASSGQVELSVTPYYHPILPLLCNTGISREANPKAQLPKIPFSHPQDAQAQVNQSAEFFRSRFGFPALGMWPSEQSVSEHILGFIREAGIKWIVTDEAVLFKSLRSKRRDTRLLYQPHLLKRKEGELAIIFRDRNLSDLIGFTYHKMKTEDAVKDFLGHLENIAAAFKNEDILVAIAMDGENAWEYYPNDGHDFLNLLYQRLSEAKNIITTTVSGYLKAHPAKREIKHLAAGSWIFGDFGKLMGNPKKLKAWEYLAQARKELDDYVSHIPNPETLRLAWKQMYILEGSDWFWWAGEDPDGSFDRLFRRHLRNFYQLIEKAPPDYLNAPL